MRTFALAAGLTLSGLPGSAQSVDDVFNDAGESIRYVICAAYFDLSSVRLGAADAPEADIERALTGRDLSARGAAVLRLDEFGEEVAVALETANQHADIMGDFFRESFLEDPAGFDEQFKFEERLEECAPRAAFIAEALDLPPFE